MDTGTSFAISAQHKHSRLDVSSHCSYDSYYRIAHAALLYLLRPNPASQRHLAEGLNRIFPSKPTGIRVGMPIRGSDKCPGESTCLPFANYMNLAQEEFATSVILTTEDEKILDQRHRYRNQSNFYVNTKDTLQGTGNVHTFGDEADDIMESSLLAIQMQLHSSIVLGNCCSNFHLMIFDLVREGCGAPNAVAKCLQETKELVCCGWTKTPECRALQEGQRNGTLPIV